MTDDEIIEYSRRRLIVGVGTGRPRSAMRVGWSPSGHSPPQGGGRVLLDLADHDAYAEGRTAAPARGSQSDRDSQRARTRGGPTQRSARPNDHAGPSQDRRCHRCGRHWLK